jgi:hypothetical protein
MYQTLIKYFDKSKGDKKIMNTFMNQLSNDFNYKRTENGALAHKTTNSAVYDMFAMGAAYRKRSDEDCILLFKNAFEEDSVLALKCLFYIRDCRGGQGERRFFRTCFRWLAENKPVRARNLIEYLPEYGRYDDLFELFGTPVEKNVMDLIKYQLKTDMTSDKNGISLIAKWLPSENASNKETIARAKKIRQYLGITSKQYRQMLSKLRTKINVLEKLMSANEWDKIEFDKIPSRAGMIYRNAFARRDIIAKRYESFAKNKNTKVNASVLYPYEIVAKATTRHRWAYDFNLLTDVDRAMINKYWENLPDYLNGKNCSMMCVVDTSGSMTGSNAAAPINVAISLGLYCAERIGGPFKNHYISFASRPQLIKTEGIDFVDKVRRIYKTNLCDNTDLEAVFDLLLRIATKRGVNPNDIPKTIVVISDMEIDSGTGYWSRNQWTKTSASTEMEKIRQKWAAYGLQLPKLIYWNVESRNENTFLDAGPNVSFVSGMSPTIFRQVLTGKTGYDLMLEAIDSERYAVIK